MKKEKSSETAVQMALSRTIESLKTEEERICYDPLAKDFLTLKYKILIQNKLLRNSVVKIIDQLFIGHHYYVIARTRYIDDFLQECCANEIQQVVIREIFYTLKEAKTLIEKWRMEYNTFRPHSSLNYRSPAPEAYLN